MHFLDGEFQIGPFVTGGSARKKGDVIATLAPSEVEANQCYLHRSEHSAVKASLRILTDVLFVVSGDKIKFTFTRTQAKVFFGWETHDLY